MPATTTESRALILRGRMRDAQAQATAADTRWNRLNDAFKVKHGREQSIRESSGREPKSDLQMASEKTDSLALKDAFAVQAWWRAQAQYLATLLLAEVQAEQYLRGLYQ